MQADGNVAAHDRGTNALVPLPRFDLTAPPTDQATPEELHERPTAGPSAAEAKRMLQIAASNANPVSATQRYVDAERDDQGTVAGAVAAAIDAAR